MSNYSCGHKVKSGLCPICVQEDIDKRHNEKLELLEQLTQAHETIKKLEEQIEAGFMGGESSNLNVIETLGKRVDELEMIEIAAKTCSEAYFSEDDDLFMALLHALFYKVNPEALQE